MLTTVSKWYGEKYGRLRKIVFTSSVEKKATNIVALRILRSPLAYF